MLHIKLPKGKVSKACERAAEQCSQNIAMANDRFRSELEQYRKTMYTENPDQPPALVKPEIIMLTEERHRLHQMADMAKHSTGDVYVSVTLWDEIKGDYDA